MRAGVHLTEKVLGLFHFCTRPHIFRDRWRTKELFLIHVVVGGMLIYSIYIPTVSLLEDIIKSAYLIMMMILGLQS